MRYTASRGAADRRYRSFRGWRRAAVAALALAIVFGLATARLFVWPTEGMPAHVGAIVMLAGPGNRLPVALQLAREHRAPILAVSQGRHGYGGPCPSAVPGVKLICFDPNPGNTRGEAEFTGRLAKQYHLTSVVLVTIRAQATRARILSGDCFGGSVYVITASLPLSNWAYEIAYEWGALLKALFLDRAC
jgi:uncharacterized SAM-binding protein YcdF (DUF218 family)